MLQDFLPRDLEMVDLMARGALLGRAERGRVRHSAAAEAFA